MSDVLPLEFLQAGEIAEVVEITGNETLVARLAENGLKAGGRVEAIQPGNPFLIRVDETRLSLRADGQVEILVRRLKH